MTYILISKFYYFGFLYFNKIVQKLNIELNFARCALEEAIRDQGDVGVARKRAAWLEEKIESIILSQNEACIIHNLLETVF